MRLCAVTLFCSCRARQTRQLPLTRYTDRPGANTRYFRLLYTDSDTFVQSPTSKKSGDNSGYFQPDSTSFPAQSQQCFHWRIPSLLRLYHATPCYAYQLVPTRCSRITPQITNVYCTNHNRCDRTRRNDDTLVVVLVLLILILLPLVLLVALDFRSFLQLLLPHIVGAVLVHIREDDIKDVAIPFRGLAFDTFADVLGAC